MKTKAKILVTVLGALSLFTQSCQTVRGAGQDIQRAGSAIQGAATR